MAALLNISQDAARDLEDNFVSVLDRALDGDQARVRNIARQLIERLDLSGYQIGREDLHREDDALASDVDDSDWDEEMPSLQYGRFDVESEDLPLLLLDAQTANDA